MPGPVQPSQRLIGERAERVAYAALELIERELAGAQNGSALHVERIDALANVLHGATTAFQGADDNEDEF